VSSGGPGRRGERGNATEPGPRGLGTDPLRVVAGNDENLSGGVRSDPERVQELRRDLAGQLLEEGLVLFDLDVQVPPPTGQGAKGVLGGGERSLERARPQAGAPIDELHLRQALEFLPELGWCSYDQRLQGDHRRGAGLHRGVLGHLELPKHLDHPVGALRRCLRSSGEHGACSVLRIQDVALALQPTLPPIVPGHLDHRVPPTASQAGEGRPVGTGSFDPEREDLPQGGRPLQESLVARSVDRDRDVAQSASELIECHADVDVLVGVDADRHSTSTLALRHARQCCCPSFRTRVAAMPAGRVDGTVTRPGLVRLLLGHCPSGQGILLVASFDGRQINSQDTQTSGSVVRRVRPPNDARHSHSRRSRRGSPRS